MNQCHGCGAAVAGEDWRLLPAWVDDGLVDGVFCEHCWPDALARVRDYITAADPDEFEDVMRAALIRAYLGGRGVEITPPGDLEPTGLVPDALRLLDQVRARGGFWWRQVMCSDCLALRAELDITTIPWWNDSMADYVTTFRCKACLPTALDDTRARVATNANDDVSRVCAMLERHGVFVHEHRRGDPVEVVRPVVASLLARLGDGSLVLPIGKTVAV